MPKDKIVTYWTGDKLRYRKDGRPDRRYKLAKQKEVVGKDVKKYARNTRSNFRGWLKFGLLALVGYILAWAIIILVELITGPREIISPLGKTPAPVVHAQEDSVGSRNICDEDYITKEICKYDWDSNIMIAVAKSENGYRMRGNNWKEDAYHVNNNGTVDVGILMINSIHGHDLSYLLDYTKNIKAGYQVWLRQGYNAWTDYLNGNYKEYLQ